MPASESFIRGYIACLFWQATDVGGDETDLAPEATEKIRSECNDFYDANRADIEEWGNDEDAGHNFLLTRNGHGAGFWDRGRGDVGDRLTEASKMYAAVYVYDGDDGLVYVD